MPPLDEQDLSQQAHDDCLEHAENTISGELQVELLESDLEWDPVTLRHVFDQSMVVWRRFGEFEVVLDEEGRPVGFLDSGGWEECESAPISVSQALAVAMASGWFTSRLEASGELVEAEMGSRILKVVDGGRPEARQQFTIEVNPKRMTLISILPSGYGTDGP